ncbi:hypothetical protein ABAZ39_07380 [Azospirillum argentinense]|uniref:Uncharacterized protein n=1 Tax=Azospirillum argentinense TaxID=2970906 RepID=A0A060DCD8_9PROT|nr:hypothetical protein [Azospirillum argentinense]AIB11821.1 hypothetical protein ABAZ39_07380 [Azospirillum argentinense]EZQ09775.1 hypothetical protein ABAZ39_08795 [Azospirillum argentinense]
MADALLDRAKGPRTKMLMDPLGFELGARCPFCQEDITDVPKKLHRRNDGDWGVRSCPDCGREVLTPAPDRSSYSVGLLSPADMKYLAARGAQGEGA